MEKLAPEEASIVLSPQEELQLVGDAKNGDADAFGLLSENYRGQITGYFAKRTGNFSDAEDLAQNTFLKAFNKVDTFDSNKGHFGAWIYGIAHNELVNLVRTDRRQRCVVLQEDNVQNDGGISLTDDVISVNSALKMLRPEQRRLLAMRFLDNMGYRQIAEQLDRNPSTVQNAARRLQKKLGVALG